MDDTEEGNQSIHNSPSNRIYRMTDGSRTVFKKKCTL